MTGIHIARLRAAARHRAKEKQEAKGVSFRKTESANRFRRMQDLFDEK
nr:MAG TPA: hypothetical protein [Caudoviricetes sp.]